MVALKNKQAAEQPFFVAVDQKRTVFRLVVGNFGGIRRGAGCKAANCGDMKSWNLVHAEEIAALSERSLSNLVVKVRLLLAFGRSRPTVPKCSSSPQAEQWQYRKNRKQNLSLR